jgi:hypothetical protein
MSQQASYGRIEQVSMDKALRTVSGTQLCKGHSIIKPISQFHKINIIFLWLKKYHIFIVKMFRYSDMYKTENLPVLHTASPCPNISREVRWIWFESFFYKWFYMMVKLSYSCLLSNLLSHFHNTAQRAFTLFFFFSKSGIVFQCSDKPSFN